MSERDAREYDEDFMCFIEKLLIESAEELLPAYGKLLSLKNLLVDGQWVMVKLPHGGQMLAQYDSGNNAFRLLNNLLVPVNSVSFVRFDEKDCAQ